MDVVTRADEDLLLELLNTTPAVDGGRVDELAENSQGRAWALARGGSGAKDEVEALRDLRDALRAVIVGDTPADALGAYVDRITARPRWRHGTLEWEFDSLAGGAIGARSLLAWAGISQRAPGRLRPCANGDCCLFLLDRSNANTARWCSMAVCGNRAKVRRHYQRARGTAPQP